METSRAEWWAARAGDRPSQRSPGTCTPYWAQQPALKTPGWQRPQGQGDVHGARLRAMLPPHRVFPSWEKLFSFSLSLDSTVWNSGGPGIHCAGWHSHSMLRATQNALKVREVRRCQGVLKRSVDGKDRDYEQREIQEREPNKA